MGKQLSGLVLHGIVENRHYNEAVDNKKAYVIYTIKTTDDTEWRVTEWEPDKEKCYNKKENVSINVRVNTYKNAKGDARYSLNVDKGNEFSLGTEF